MATDNENELDATRMSAGNGNQSDDGRQQTFNSYVTNRVSVHCNIRLVKKTK